MRNKAGRRDLMIKAAWACFIRNGYDKTALGDVAQEAGISRTLIYQEFANKEELFATLIAERLNEQFELAKAKDQKGGWHRGFAISLDNVITHR